MDGSASPGGPNFSGRLENYLRSNRSTRNSLYADVPDTLRQKEHKTHESLGADDLADYSGYSTLFRYDAQARFVNGVSDAVEAAQEVVGGKTVAVA